MRSFDPDGRAQWALSDIAPCPDRVSGHSARRASRLSSSIGTLR